MTEPDPEKVLDLLRYFSRDAVDLPEDEPTLTNVLKQLLAMGVGPGHALVDKFLNKGQLILDLLDMRYFEVLRIFFSDFQIDIFNVKEVREPFGNWLKEKFFYFSLLRNEDLKTADRLYIPEDVFYLIARHLFFLE